MAMDESASLGARERAAHERKPPNDLPKRSPWTIAGPSCLFGGG
jgi:hypothetical protein